jgi:hypothetical protein
VRLLGAREQPQEVHKRIGAAVNHGWNDVNLRNQILGYLDAVALGDFMDLSVADVDGEKLLVLCSKVHLRCAQCRILLRRRID